MKLFLKNIVHLVRTQPFQMMVLGAVLVFFSLARQSFGLDESFSVFISRSWSTMLNTIWNQEANMWLYYIILHFWLQIGQGEFVVRALSAVFALATIPVTFATAKLFFSKRAALLSSVLMIVNIFYVFYAQEARSYSLLLLLTSLFMYFFLRLSEGKKYQLAYIVTGVLAVYTHFYAGFVLLAHILMLLHQKQVRKYAYMFVCMGVLLIPLLVAPSMHSHQVDWLLPPTVSSLIGTFFVLTGDMPPLVLLYTALFLGSAVFLFKNILKKPYIYLLLWISVPILTAFAFSVIVKPIYQSVYFLMCLPAFIMLCASLIDRIQKSWVKKGLVILIVAFSLVRLGLWYTENTQIKWVISNKTDDWRDAEKYIADNANEDDVTVFYGYYGRIPFSMYTTSKSPQILEISSGKYNLGGGSKLPEPNVNLLSGLSNERVWVVLNRSTGVLFDREKQRDEILSILDKKYFLVRENDFEGIRVLLLQKL